MRTVIIALAFIALPAMAVAQQVTDEAADLKPPQVELQQTAPSGPASVDVVETERADRDQVEVQSQTVADDAAMQDPTQQRWWWLVGAIVVAGIILAVIL